jgi:hypothetical protein
MLDAAQRWPGQRRAGLDGEKISDSSGHGWNGNFPATGNDGRSTGSDEQRRGSRRDLDWVDAKSIEVKFNLHLKSDFVNCM